MAHIRVTQMAALRPDLTFWTSSILGDLSLTAETDILF